MQDKRAILPWIIFIGLALVWGSSFILMKRGSESFHYLEVGAIRLAFAFWFTALIGIRKFKNFNSLNLLPLLLVGFLGNGFPYILFPLAVTAIDSSTIGVINSLVPLFTLVVGFILYKYAIRRLQFIGIIVGFFGAYLLINPSSTDLGPQWYYVFFAATASLCYALSINIISNQLKELDSLSITLLSLSFVGIPATIYIFMSDVPKALVTDQQAWLNFGYIAILGIIGTSIAVILFNYLIKISSPVFSASVTYFIPLVALIWGWIDGETISWFTILGVAFILSGVYMVNKKKGG